jgi:hypothetical protein
VQLTAGRKKLVAAGIAAALLLAGLAAVPGMVRPSPKQTDIHAVLGMTSARKASQEMSVAVPSTEPFLALAAAPAACWYDISQKGEEGAGLLPLLIIDGSPDDAQYRLLDYTGRNDILSIGETGPGVTPTTEIKGRPQEVSVQLAKHLFDRAAGVLAVPMTPKGYELGVAAAPLASYLNIPVILVGASPDWKALAGELSPLRLKYVAVVGGGWEQASAGMGLPALDLGSMKAVWSACALAVADRFGALNYVAAANPADATAPAVKSVSENVTKDTITDLKMVVVGKEMDIIGASGKSYDIDVPGGTVLTEIFVNITSLDDPLRQVKRAAGVNPMISMEVHDASGMLIAYAPSMAYLPSRAWTDFLSVDAPGKATVTVSMYYGTKGFAALPLPGATGYSRIDATFDLTVRHTQLARPHLPRVPNASMLAPYLAAVHGGLVYADPAWELTSDNYTKTAAGHQTWPAYDEELQAKVNGDIESSAGRLEAFVEGLGAYKTANGSLKDSYLSGPAWLALLGDANMVPMYYDQPGAQNDYPWGGTGLATDNLYTLNFTLSAARPMGRSAADSSTLIARTLFYEDYSAGHAARVAADYPAGNDWGSNYMFLFGEGGGQTGYIFWQTEFSREVEQHGFHSEVYGHNSNNDRQTMEAAGAYVRANYMEFMLHGNWYWFVPEINGIDQYSTSVKNTDIFRWDLGPSVYLTAACLMGRIDCIPAEEAICANFIHAGLNAFVGATRSTGSESGTRWMEWDLLYNDTSMGEALRLSKIDHPAEPTLQVRTLYADPAFNPYEPENGYSGQGRPVMRQR